MRGAPRFFATKQDYLNGISVYPEETKTALRALVADRFHFVKTDELAEGEDGINDDSHMVLVISEKNEETGKDVEKRWQMKREENKNARLFRLGFTLEEASALIS